MLANATHVITGIELGEHRVGVGYISKAAPNASNILELVQAIKPIAGLLLLLLLLPNLMSITHQYTEQTIPELDTLLRLAAQR